MEPVDPDTFTGVAAIGQTWIIVIDTGVIYRPTDNGSVGQTHRSNLRWIKSNI